MIRAIIVDDEAAAAQSLQTDLKWYCEDLVEIVGEARNLTDGIQLIADQKPALVFLDIDMGQENGFMLLERIRREAIDIDVIFTTGHNEFAINAIRKDAFDYLLKPVDPDLLREALVRLEKKLKEKQTKDDGKKSLDASIALPMQDQVLVCPLDQLIRCESERNYTRFYIHDRSPVLVSRTLGYYEETLLQNNFFRPHKSHIINLGHLESYIRQDGGYLLMKDGSQVPLSRHKRTSLFEILGI